MDKKFYEKTLREDRQYSYKVIAKYLKRTLFPDMQSVIELGCGAGWFLYYLQSYGVGDIVGIEAKSSEKPVETIMPASVGKNVKFRTLNRLIDLKRPFDLSLCIEVAEHLEEKYANTLIKNITRHSRYVVFSAATPDQGGVGHINEQPFEYWEAKFKKNDYELVECMTEEMRDFLKTKKSKDGHLIKKWYVNNISVFRKIK